MKKGIYDEKNGKKWGKRMNLGHVIVDVGTVPNSSGITVCPTLPILGCGVKYGDYKHVCDFSRGFYFGHPLLLCTFNGSQV